MTPEQLKARNAAIAAAWDDPLLRAIERARNERPGSKRSSRKAFNAYYRVYRAKRKVSREPS